MTPRLCPCRAALLAKLHEAGNQHARTPCARTQHVRPAEGSDRNEGRKSPGERRDRRLVPCVCRVPMPSREQILESLTRAANEGLAFAIAWHLVAFVAIVAVVGGWRPSSRLAGVLLAVPFVSASVASWSFHNPFNGWVFAGLAMALALVAALRKDRGPVQLGPRWSQLVGGAMITIGLTYPHFLVNQPPLEYLLAAPLGLIPCPTLAAVSGLALLWRGLGNRPWSEILALAAGCYAIFGSVRLGVWIDVALLAGAMALIVVTRECRQADEAGLHSRASLTPPSSGWPTLGERR